MRYLGFVTLWCRLAWLTLIEHGRGCRSEYVFEGRRLTMTQTAWLVSRARWP